MNIRGTVSICLIFVSTKLVACSSGTPETGEKAQEVTAGEVGAACDVEGPPPGDREVIVQDGSPSCETNICLHHQPQADAAYCSCRCDGPEGTGPFCACPGDFECRPMISDFGVESSSHLVGSYCVKSGTVEDR